MALFSYADRAEQGGCGGQGQAYAGEQAAGAVPEADLVASRLHGHGHEGDVAGQDVCRLTVYHSGEALVVGDGEDHQAGGGRVDMRGEAGAAYLEAVAGLVRSEERRVG